MKIAVSISNSDEIESLAALGANEFQCNFKSVGGRGEMRAVKSMDHFACGFRSLVELARAVRFAHRSGCPISLALDVRGRTDESLAEVAALADAFLDMGGDALVMPEFGLIGDLSPLLALGRIHVRAHPACSMSSTVWFCRQMGVTRLVLPDGASMSEACRIAADARDLEIEACLEYRDGLLARRPFPDAGGGPLPSRGLRVLSRLLAGGVTALRIPGCQRPTARKLALVRTARLTLDRLAAGGYDASVIRSARTCGAFGMPRRTGSGNHYAGVSGH